MVSNLRKSILGDSPSIPAERTFVHHKTGTVATMNTENIGAQARVGMPAEAASTAAIRATAALWTLLAWAQGRPVPSRLLRPPSLSCAHGRPRQEAEHASGIRPPG